jgi:PPE-repeat protein
VNFLVLPPEINSAQMFSGAGSGPMLAAASAWDGLAGELDAAAESFSSVTSGLTSQAWQGPASQAMAAAAAPYASWLSAAAAQASGASAQAQSVATAFESALAATVHPVSVAANRSDLVSLVMTNLFGQNAPAIAATEGQYEQMWAQDVTAMVGYHGGASAAAAQLASPVQALQNLPGLAANDIANTGFGNVGTGNVGFFNAGIGNVGIGNAGYLNAGIGNLSLIPDFNNPTPSNVTSFLGGSYGLFNAGSLNFGIGNVGFLNVGIGNLSPSVVGMDSFGNPLIPIGNSGLFNNGMLNQGAWNTGLANTGIGNTGSFNTGIGLNGTGLAGIGPLAWTP